MAKAKAPKPAQTIALDPNDYLEMVSAYDAAEIAIENANAAKKAIRKRAKARGVDLAAFDLKRRLRKEADKDPKRPGALLGNLTRYAAWEGEPLYTQSELFPKATEKPTAKAAAAFTDQQCYDQGWRAGMAGGGRDANPFSAGTSSYERFDSGWLAALSKNAEALGEGTVTALSRPTSKRANQSRARVEPDEEGVSP